MNIEDVLNKLKDLAEEWESFECNHSQESEEWCSATEDSIWSCAEKLNDIIAEIEDEDL